MKYTDSPCMNCENKGCGVYHDECKKYQDFKKQRLELTKEKANVNNHKYLRNQYLKDYLFDGRRLKSNVFRNNNN